MLPPQLHTSVFSSNRRGLPPAHGGIRDKISVFFEWATATCTADPSVTSRLHFEILPGRISKKS
jgi:hypothetical protein